MTPRNHVLAALPYEEWGRLAPLLHRVDLRTHHVLYNTGDRIDRLYFPESCIVSLIVELVDGRSAECGVVGCEGVLGVGGALAGAASYTLQRVLVGGGALVLERRSLSSLDERFPALRKALHAAHDAFIALILQSAACSAAHPAPARLARALLNLGDRSRADTLHVTQEALALSIGASRPTTTTILGDFEQAGMISARRGVVELLNRRALEGVACCCYSMTANLYPRLR